MTMRVQTDRALLIRLIERYELACEALDRATRSRGRRDFPTEGEVQVNARFRAAARRLYDALPGTDVPGWGNGVAYRGRVYLAGPGPARVTVAYVSEDLDGSLARMDAGVHRRSFSRTPAVFDPPWPGYGDC